MFGLHLRGNPWLVPVMARPEFPELVPAYRQLYGSGAYLPKTYRDELRRRVAPLLAAHGLVSRIDAPKPAQLQSVSAVEAQPTLF